ncbi:MAG: hypothetical protein HQM10_21995 [Candidatus Riflebacteria bacterium]|nr:hypothetical protein [Candidatus Riflebacteria bacterium]
MLRNPRIILILCLFHSLLGLWFFTGCGGGGSHSGDDPVSEGIISGTLYNTYPSIRDFAASGEISADGPQASLLAGVITGEATVYLENNPSISTRTSGGKFSMVVPYSNYPYKVIAVWTDSYSRKKLQRSVDVYVNDSNHEAKVPPTDRPDARMDFSKSNAKARVAIKDPSGASPVNTEKISLWGIPGLFSTVDAGQGLFESPMIPDEIPSATISISPTGYNQIYVPLQFTASSTNGAAPPTVEITVVKSGEMNQAPVVALSADKYSSSDNSQTITLSGKVSDDTMLSQSNVSLITDHGSISNFSFNGTDVTGKWLPPLDGNGTATITLIASDSYGLSGKAKVFVSYGFSSASNQPPTISSINSSSNPGSSLLPGTIVTLTAQASDPNGDTPLTYSWTQTGTASGTFSSPNASSTLWTASSGSGTVYINVKVSDPKGAYNSDSVTFIISSTPTNTQPYVSILYPEKNALISKGNVTLTAQAVDSSGRYNLTTSNASFAWSISPANQTPSVIPGLLSVQVSITTAATYTVSFTATSNGVSSTTTRVFRINERPTVTISQPANNDVYLASTSIQFVASANDIETGIIPSASLSWTIPGASGTISGSSYTTKDLPAGKNTVYANAEDNLGEIGTATIFVYINEPPVISTATTNPVGPDFTASQSITFVGDATDPQGDVLASGNFLWFDGSTQIGTGTSVATTTYGWTAGAHNIKLYVQDNGLIGKGYATSTASFSINIGGNQTPSISITSPAADSVYAPNTTITFIASASDVEDGTYGGASTNVRWLEGATTLALGTTCNIATLSGNASHTVIFQVTDSGGLATSTSIVVGVWNQSPTMAITSPATNTVYLPGATITLTADASDFEDGVYGPGSTSVRWLEGATTLALGTTCNVATLTGNASHVITLRVTDAHSTVVSTAITIGVWNRSPSINSYSPTGTPVYALGSTVNLSASASDPEDGGLAADRIGWFKTSVTPANFLGSGTLAISTFTAGVQNLILYVMDSQASPYTGSATQAISFTISSNNLPVVTIASPSADWVKIMKGSANVTLTGSANDSEEGNIASSSAYSWLASTTSSSIATIGTGLTYTITTMNWSVGTHTLRLLASDSFGGIGSTTKTIFVSDNPKIQITGAAGPYTNAVESIALVASSSDAFAAEFPSANLTWYVDGLASSTAAGSKNFNWLPNVGSGELGTTSIRVVGSDAYGNTTSATVDIYINSVPSALGTNYSDNQRFETGTAFTFVATATDLTPGDSLKFKWETSRDGISYTQIATTSTTSSSGNDYYTSLASASLGAAGTWTIRLTAYDRGSDTVSISKTVLYNRLATPTLDTITTAFGGQYSTSAGGLPVYVVSSQTTVTLVATGTDFEDATLSDASYSWEISGTEVGPPTASTRTFVTAITKPGTYTAKIYYRDSFQNVASKTFLFAVWKMDAIKSLSLSNTSAGIEFDSTNMLVVDSGNKLIKKSAPPFSSVGSSFTSVDTWTTGIIDMTKVNTSFFILDQAKPGVFKINEGLTASQTDYLALGLPSPLGIDSNGSDRIFITNYPSQEVKVYDASMNLITTCVSEISSSPTGISFYSGTQFYLAMGAGSTGSVVKKIDWFNQTIIPGWGTSGVASFSFGSALGIDSDSSGRVFVADTLKNKIKVLDQNGNLWADFGASSGEWQFNSPTGITYANSKLYFVDSKRQRVVQVDFGGF